MNQPLTVTFSADFIKAWAEVEMPTFQAVCIPGPVLTSREMIEPPLRKNGACCDPEGVCGKPRTYLCMFTMKDEDSVITWDSEAMQAGVAESG